MVVVAELKLEEHRSPASCAGVLSALHHQQERSIDGLWWGGRGLGCTPGFGGLNLEAPAAGYRLRSRQQMREPHVVLKHFLGKILHQNQEGGQLLVKRA